MIPSVSEQKQKNPYYPAFDHLLAKLLAAEQALELSESTFDHLSESQEEWLARLPEGDLPGMIANICDTSDPGYVKYIPSLRFPDREIKHLLRAVRDFRTQSYLWTIARTFESFREFAEAVGRALPSQMAARSSHPLARVVRPVRRRQKRVNRRFIDTLKQIRRVSPTLSKCETQNTRRLHLPQWISVAEAVRNAVAHNEGIMGKEVYKKYSSSGLQTYFPGEMEENTGYVLKPSPDTVEKTIQTFREYGVAIYKAVSDAQGFPAILVGQDGEITTWRR